MARSITGTPGPMVAPLLGGVTRDAGISGWGWGVTGKLLRDSEDYSTTAGKTRRWVGTFLGCL